MGPLKLAVLLACALACRAQDTRPILEPSFPLVCAQLTAQLTAGPSGLPTASETAFDTARIQSALNACPPGQAVELASAGGNNAFLLAPIQLPKGVTLLVDAAVTVYASRNPRDYDAGSNQSCGTSASGSGCVALITANSADGAGIMGYGAIDGRGGSPLLINGASSQNTWWDSTNGTTGNCPRMLQVNGSNNFTVYKITLLNGACTVHVGLDDLANFTAYGVKIIAPYDTPNTAAISTGHWANNITIANSYFSEGDDNVAINSTVSPPGTPAGTPGNNHISVVNNHFGDGHGASIGSVTNGGVTNVLFQNNTFNGDPANRNQTALRIKSDVSRGGVVQNIAYRNICIQNSRYALVFNPFYTSGATGTLVPWFKDISMSNVHATTEGLVQISGHDASVPTAIAMSNVQVDGVKPSDVTSQGYVNLNVGPGPVNFAGLLKGPGVTVTDQSISGIAPYPCPASVFPTVAGELVPGPSQMAAQQSFNLSAQVLPLKEIPYQTYLKNPSAGLSLPAPTGTVRILEGANELGSAQFNGGTWVSVPVHGLPPGAHTLTAAYSGDSNYPPITFGSYNVTAGVVLPPAIAAGGIVNAASGASGPIAQGSIFSIYGTNLGPAAASASYPLPVSFGGVTVQITAGGNSYNAFLQFVSASQINAVLPSGVPAGPATLTVTFNGSAGQPASFNVAATQPGIFFQPPNAAVAQNVASATDYPLNAPTAPAKPGQIVILWGTGLGPIGVPDNDAPGAGDMTGVPVTIAVGGIPAQRLYAGRAPGVAAVDNVYFTVPDVVPYGCQVPVAITAAGAPANTTSIAITSDGTPCQ
jgi:uncharacterized protein (TIGR03437 family)